MNDDDKIFVVHIYLLNLWKKILVLKITVKAPYYSEFTVRLGRPAVARAGEAHATFTAFPLSFPCDAHIPHLSSLVRQSDFC